MATATGEIRRRGSGGRLSRDLYRGRVQIANGVRELDTFDQPDALVLKQIEYAVDMDALGRFDATFLSVTPTASDGVGASRDVGRSSSSVSARPGVVRDISALVAVESRLLPPFDSMPIILRNAHTEPNAHYRNSLPGGLS